MKCLIAFACFIVFFAQTSVFCSSPQVSDKNNKTADFAFASVNYFHRFTQANQHEYTPERQADLNRWTDMVTINYYPKAKDGDSLAATANEVLENYKANKGLVVKTDSIARTRLKPAEHLIVVIFPRPTFIEVAFARFRMHRGIGSAVIYSHRIYGTKAGNEMENWLEKNGLPTEKSLMVWDAMPRTPAVKSP